MIDIHCHIIPGIDDGPKTTEDAILMARAAVAEGIETIIATPHWNATFLNHAASIRSKTKDLQQALDEEGIPLTILPGQEPRISGEMVERLNQGELMPITGDGEYVFVEFPFDSVPRFTKQLLFHVQLEGYTPIIVHPERNVQLREHPGILFDFVQTGVLTQVTAASLTGRFGKKIQTYSHQLIEFNQCHLIASDAHDTVKRSFHLKEAYTYIEENWGSSRVDQFQANAEAVIRHEMVYADAPLAVKKKKWLGLF